MRRHVLAAAAVAALALTHPFPAHAQAGAPDSSGASGASAPKAEKSVTHGTVTVEGKQISYRAVAGTIILKDDDGKPTGSMFYVAPTPRRGPSRSSTTAAPAPRPCGSTWAPSGPAGWPPPTTATTLRRPTGW